jgi:hypothetical protein
VGLARGKTVGGVGALSCAILAATVLLIIQVGPASAGPNGGWERCGRSAYAAGLFVYAKGVGCKKARRVAREGGENLGECIDSGCQASDFACRAKPNEIEGGTIVCRRGEQRVKFGYGG